MSHAYIAHSVFKQTVLNVRSHQLQQHTIEICCKTRNSAIAEGPREALVSRNPPTTKHVT